MKAGFRNRWKATHLGGKNFRLDTELRFYSEKYDRIFVAPKGTITNLASIPAIAQSFVQVLGNNIRSATLHDYNCRTEGKAANQVSQKMADDLFREGLAVDNVRWSKARVMYGAVTLFQRAKYLFKKEKYGDLP